MEAQDGRNMGAQDMTTATLPKPPEIVGDKSDLADHLSEPLLSEAERALEIMVVQAERKGRRHGRMLSDGKHEVYAYGTVNGVSYGLNAPEGNVWRRMKVWA
jgi:hypothetical protein